MLDLRLPYDNSWQEKEDNTRNGRLLTCCGAVLCTECSEDTLLQYNLQLGHSVSILGRSVSILGRSVSILGRSGT